MFKKSFLNRLRKKLVYLICSCKNGEQKLKHTTGCQGHSLFLIGLLICCTVFFVSCSGDTTSNSSAITPIGAPTTCLTLHTPALVKLADGNYKLGDEIDNCGGKNVGPVQVTVQIDQQTMNLPGPTTIPANSKATYNTFADQSGKTEQEIHFPSPLPASTALTILATINSQVQGEWDGTVTIPA